MSEHRGYKIKSLKFLQKNNIKVGDTIKIFSDLTYEGILMPRYEQSDDHHIVLKLKSGYNVGVEIDDVKKIEILSSNKIKPESDFVQKKSNPELPKILLLSTGGTIASKVDYRTGAVTPALTAEDLISTVPELAEITNIDADVLFSEYSENLQPENWKAIAKKLDSYVNSDYKGIIIAHGTDTMQYTASFLSFALSGFPKPIVLVGSQRSSDRPSSDASQNLISAVRFIVKTNSNGVYVVMHHNESDELIACHAGTRVRKNHTSKRGAFQTIGEDPAFLVMGEKVQKNLKRKFFTEDDYTPKLNFDSRVALVKYHPGFDPKIIENIIELGYQAIIFEGTGLGHIGTTMYESVKKAHEKGLFLGMTSQCIAGRVRMTVYESGRDLMELGIIPLEDMIPETALVKAMWVLGNCKNVEEMKKIMLDNIAMEFAD